MIIKCRPVLNHSPAFWGSVFLVTLLLCTTMVSAAASPALGMTASPTLVVVRTIPPTPVPTPVPTVTCQAPCECLARTEAVAKWGSNGFSQCAELSCGSAYGITGAPVQKFCYKPLSSATPVITTLVPVGISTLAVKTPVAIRTFGCPSGKTFCNASACVDMSSDVKNCGSCGTTCTIHQDCTNGQCTPKIVAVQSADACAYQQKTNCGGTCIDTQGSDSNNCGGCGWVCPGGLSCYQGECSMDCPAGQADCNYNCVEVLKDPENCGTCGNACAAGWSCCNGKCTDTKSDAFSCGSCGKQCETTKNQVCKNGFCGCKPDMLICDTNIGCMDVQTNWEHCGSCNNKCASPEICVDGACGFEPTCGTKNYQTNTYETCADNIQNQDETGVDCGGSRCAPCNTKCTTGTKYAPADTPCTSVYNYQSIVANVPSSNYPDDPYYVNMLYDACPFCNYPCRSNEVCHPALDPMIEEALKCCSMTSLDDIDSQMPDPDTCRYAVKMAPYGCQKCTGIYIIKELADGTRWMHGYNDEQNTAQANLSKKYGQTPPYGTANYLLNYYHTGICHDYATAVTTLLRKAGYSQDDVGTYCDGAHCYNVVRFPGDTKWNVVDTDATQEGGATWTLGKIQSGYPYCHTMDETSIFYNMGTYYTSPIPDINAYWTTVKNGQTYSYQQKQPFQPQCTGPGSATPCSIVYGGPPLSGPGVGGVGKDYWQLPSKGVPAKQMVGC